MEGVYVEKEVSRTSARTGKRITAAGLLLVTCGIFILYLIGGQTWQAIRQGLVKIDSLTPAEFNLSTPADCILIKEETVLFSPEAGRFTLLVKEGLKVKGGHPVGKILPAEANGSRAEVILRAPRAGLVCTHLDGLENILKTAHIDALEMDGIRKIVNNEETGQRSGIVEKGSPALKVLDNLAPLRIYLEVPTGALPDKAAKGTLLTLLWQGREVKGRVEDLKTNAGKNRLIILVNNYPDTILHLRMIRLDLVRERVAGFRVPSSALVDGEGGKGIYIDSKNRVKWLPVEVKGSVSEYTVITGPGLGPETRYVMNPRWVRAGDRVK